MSKEIKGNLVNFQWRNSGTANAFKTIVCVESSDFTISSAVTKRQTNCGRKGAAALPDFKASINAVQNANPGATEATYQEVKAAIIAQQKVDFRYASAADTSIGLGFGDGIYNYGSGYFSELSAAASAADGEVLTYSVSFEGIGTLDVFDTDS